MSFKDWVLKWDGQSVMKVDAQWWTAAVTEGLQKKNLQPVMDKMLARIKDLVELVCCHVVNFQRISICLTTFPNIMLCI